MSDAALKRLAGPLAVTSTDTVVYTVPTGYKTIVRSVLFNPPNDSGNASVSIGATATGTRIAKACFPSGLGSYEGQSYETSIPLSAGEQLYAVGESGFDCALTIVGEEIPV